MRHPDLTKGLLCVICGLWLTGCQDYWAESAEPPPGNAQTGAELISTHGCGSCHVIPGIIGADGLTGPSLAQISLRGYLGGVLPYSHENMVRWLLDPQAVDPRSAMPDVGLTRNEAMDITAYLDTLE